MEHRFPRCGFIPTQKDWELLSAIQAGNEIVMEKLLSKYGCTLDEVINTGGFKESPYIVALKHRQWNAIPILIRHKINLNRLSSNGRVPIVLAAQKNLLDIVEIMLQNGADPNMLDVSKLCALYWAIKLKNFDMLRLLISSGADVNLNIQGRSTALHCAVASDEFDMVKTLVENNACVNALDVCGKTPLFPSVIMNNYDMTYHLLQHGSVVNVINVDHRMPLHMAAANIHPSFDITLLLLDHGALVNAPDCDGNIPLVLGLRNLVIPEQISTMECLIQHGSELNTDRSVEALEWMTMEHNNYDTMKLAIQAGFRIRGIPWISRFIQDLPTQSNTNLKNESNKVEEKRFVDYLKIHLNNPLPLTEICRTEIRAHLISVSQGKSIYYKIKQLPLPQLLIPYLQL